MKEGAGPLLYLIAGEPSGDLLGGSLMAALKRRTGGQVRFAGIGGSKMIEQGLTPLFPMTDLAVFGLAEILPRLRHLMHRGEETVADIARLKPAALVTIDSPGFTLRVAQRAVPLGVPRIHYVAPSVWAWKPERAAKIAKYLDHLLALLPFEPPYFQREGLSTTFVGHSAIEGPAGKGDGVGFRARRGLAPDRRVIVMLPGSRAGEIDRMLPVFLETLRRLQQGRAPFTVAVPAPDYLAAKVRAGMEGSGLETILLTGDAEKFDAFAAADAALAKSGTVTLELVLSGVPAVIAYKVNAISYLIAKRLQVGKYIGLPNVILDRPLMPELLQYDCTPERLTPELARLLDDPAARAAQLTGGSEIRRLLSPEGKTPSEAAADAVLGVISAR
ncbi:MAG TPA: lipid-A-disaccharide synthase [Alphaproteobacteria bacterium]|jgi:lipid-A-disaccharide synthase|nr:lipid-A-disaccharide synthase [Alphaproteobacteria bacterium]